MRYEDIDKIISLLKENEKDLYKKFTRPSFIVRLLYFQSINNLSNVHFDTLLDLLQKVILDSVETIL